MNQEHYCYTSVPDKFLSLSGYVMQAYHRALKLKHSASFPHILFKFVSQNIQRVPTNSVSSIYGTNRLEFFNNRDGECLLRGTN
jgi:hypothetical protein